jgi:hypothetical protein
LTHDTSKLLTRAAWVIVAEPRSTHGVAAGTLPMWRDRLFPEVQKCKYLVLPSQLERHFAASQNESRELSHRYTERYRPW